LRLATPAYAGANPLDDYFQDTLALHAAVGGQAFEDAANNEKVTWTSSNKNVATIAVDSALPGFTGKALVSSVGKGTATITAKTEGGKKAAVTIKVGDPGAVEVMRTDLEGSPAALRAGDPARDAVELKALAGGADSVEWASSKPSVASVTGSDALHMLADVQAKKAGKAIITATAKYPDGSTKFATFNVTVVQAAVDLKITNKKPAGNSGAAPYVMQKGKTFTAKTKLNNSVNPATGAKWAAPANKGLAWESDAPAVASVSSKGVVKALAKGDVKITVRSKDDPGVTDEFFVRVNVKATKVAMQQKKFSMRPGSVVTLSCATTPALALLSDGAGDGGFTWSENKKGKVVEFVGPSKGAGSSILVRALALPPGKSSQKVTLTAKAASGKKATMEVTVKKNAKPVVNMRLAKTAAWVKRGKSTTLKVVMNEGKDPATKKKWAAPANKNVTWSIEEYYWDGASVKSVDPGKAGSIATVNSKGKVTAKGYGYAIVTARSLEDPGRFSGSCVVYCSPKP